MTRAVIVELRTRPRTPFLIGFSSFSILEARRRRGDRAIGPYSTVPLNTRVFVELGRSTQGLIISARTLISPERDVRVALLPMAGMRVRIPLLTAEPPPGLLAELTDLFDRVPWTWAKSYSERAPHFWSKKSQFPDPETFSRVCRLIPTHGYLHRFPNAPGGSWWQAIDIPPRMVWSSWCLPQHVGLLNSRPVVWTARPAIPLYAEQELIVDDAIEVPITELLAQLPEVR